MKRKLKIKKKKIELDSFHLGNLSLKSISQQMFKTKSL